MDYKQYLNSTYWKEVVSLVRNRDNNQCQICGALTNLEIHHIAYKINGKSIIGNEKQHLKWLITLCNKHHTNVHKSKNHLLHPKGYYKLNADDFKKMFGVINHSEKS